MSYKPEISNVEAAESAESILFLLSTVFLDVLLICASVLAVGVTVLGCDALAGVIG